MQLTWKITKKRGNWRPTLSLSCEKEEWETDLRVPGGTTDIAIPRAMGWHQYRPGSGEDATIEHSCIPLPDADSASIIWDTRLPWRPGAHPEYPEVEAAMLALMREWERRVVEALDSAAIDQSGEVEHSPEYKRRVAAYVAAVKMLSK